ncbi:hypothetical protein [Propionibacterium freudenreichii]|uniref:hypothetical protein n=1 Tax=Propionibacterium freudenreichii TaxID=1744 RepID=UPI001C206699|nr:hypothetical protein [Propionibacterium freudenreichii]
MSDTSTTGRAPEPTAMRPSVAMSTMAPWRHRIPRRMIIACAVICAACVAISLLALSLGDYPLSIPEVVSALFGDQGFATTVVTQWRAPAWWPAWCSVPRWGCRGRCSRPSPTIPWVRPM